MNRIILALAAIGLFGVGYYLGGSDKMVLPMAMEPSSQLSKTDFLKYCEQNPEKVYQDVYIEGRIRAKGVNLCENRYEIIKPIVEKLGKERFSVLDVGAGLGYFSFRIASDFPKAHCYMIEHVNKHCPEHARMLYQLCGLNDLSNVTFFHRQISAEMLEQLSRKAHFDLVMALLVVHQIGNSLDSWKPVVEKLFKLGNQVLLEVSNDVAPELRDYIQAYQHPDYECTFLGEVPRYYDAQKAYSGKFPNGKGEFYLFKKKTSKATTVQLTNNACKEMGIVR